MTRVAALALGLTISWAAVCVVVVEGSDNGLVRTPPLGWMSWMYYTTDVTEEIIKGVADEMVAGGCEHPH